LLALFIISTLAPVDLPGADQTNLTLSIGERHEQQTRLGGMTDQHLTELLGLSLR
jgi:hypothetical protein